MFKTHLSLSPCNNLTIMQLFDLRGLKRKQKRIRRMSPRTPLSISASALCLCLAATSASALGLPIFTTAPATITFSNKFLPYHVFDSDITTKHYVMHVSTTIASAPGTPQLVGLPLELRIDTLGAFGFSTMKLGGVDAIPIYAPDATNLSGSQTSGTLTHEISTTSFCVAFGDCEIQWVQPYEILRPNKDVPYSSDYLTLDIMFNFKVPITRGYENCVVRSRNEPRDCHYSLNLESDFPLSRPLKFVHGQVQNATMTFGVVGGPIPPSTALIAPSPVPIPGAGLLLAGALPALAIAKRRRAKKRN
jgi:hypothetical protein